MAGTHRSAADAPLAEATSLLRAGRSGEAEALCRRVLAVHPAEPTALHLLGVCLLQQGRHEQAEQALAACLQAQPDEPAALGNRGIALQAMGRFDEALACYGHSLQRAPAQPATLNMRGLVLMELRRYDEALTDFDRAVEVAPQFAEIWCNRANALIQLRQYEQALASLDRAEALRPNYGEALSNRSIALNLLRRHAEALAAAERALKLLPGRAVIHRNIADALAGLQRRDEALAAYERAIAFQPGNFDFAAARAEMLSALGRQPEADAQLASALEDLESQRGALLSGRAEPGGDVYLQRRLAEIAFRRGQLLVDIGDHSTAVDSFAEATRWQPDFVYAHWAEALLRLRLGDYEQGWRKYEWRRLKPDLANVRRKFAVPDWNGDEDPAGLRILLHAEQGLGDAIQFSRYAPLLAKRGAQVVLEVHRPLKKLMECLDGVTVIGDGETSPDVNRHCPIMSLPYACRTTLDTVPAAVPYLRADTQRVRQWAEILGPRCKPRIGLAWSGNPRHASDHMRSIPATLLRPLMALPVEFVSLAKELRDGEREDVEALALCRLGERLVDFADTAALLENLDLVISVDTAVAHLAGALARPLWLLLDTRSDFRWLVGRSDSPWYPTARLFRQSAHGDWPGVIARVAAELASFLAEPPLEQSSPTGVACPKPPLNSAA